MPERAGLTIAMFCPYSLTRPGGVQGQVLGLSRELGKIGHHVTVIAPVDGPLDEDVLEGISLVDVGRSLTLTANGSQVPLALAPQQSVRAMRAVRSGEFDLIHLHEPLAPGPSWACLLRSKKPMVGTFHRSGSSIGYRMLKPMASWAVSRLDVRCAVSAAARETAFESLGGKYEIIGNGVDFERFEKAEPSPTVGPTVLFIGRHEQRKGLELLLKAFTELTDSQFEGEAPSSTLWISGHGPQTKRLISKYPESDSIQWLGRTSESELASRLAGADVLCAPSLRGESFGVVLIEAMAARTAIVASDIYGYSSVAQGFGDLFRPGDVEDLTRSLRQTLSDVITSTGLSSPRALARASDHASRWSMTATAEKYSEIYYKVLEDRADSHKESGR